MIVNPEVADVCTS